jgi:hypothetical protein
MRVKIHKQIETFGKTGLDRHIREEVRDVIYTQLVAFENQSKRKTMFTKIKCKKSWPWPTLFSYASANSFIRF